ncbi:MAG: zinc ribbon domain-containing protein [Chloroflexi bacterium]|nr:zinc ribbon domain-containing protein [Chloroflexota bacterium]
MPLYEYYCEDCDGIFEVLRPITRASESAPCVVCEKAGERIMPTSIAAFTLRDGYPRKLPDKGTFWHLGKEVKQRNRGRMRAFEHPEINKPKPRPRPSKGDREVANEIRNLRARERDKMIASGVRPSEHHLPRRLRKP